MICFLIVPHGSAANASSDAYDSGFDHGCNDAAIAAPPDRYLNQSGEGPEFHTNAFMDGYGDGFSVCSGSSSKIVRDGNVALPAECGMRALHDDQLSQRLSEHQCFYLNSCTNLGGSIAGCFEEARKINCNMYGERYYCPIVPMSELD